MSGTARRLISSRGVYERPFGYSRAVVVGDHCWVAGTTDPGHDHPADPAAQARAALSVIERALDEAGFSLTDVVRTRMFVTDLRYAEPVALVHGQVFEGIRPAATLVVVTSLIEPYDLVEIEAEARRAG